MRSLNQYIFFTFQKSTEQLTSSSTVTLAEDVGNVSNKTTIQIAREKTMGVCKKLTRWVVLVDLLLLGSSKSRTSSHTNFARYT